MPSCRTHSRVSRARSPRCGVLLHMHGYRHRHRGVHPHGACVYQAKIEGTGPRAHILHRRESWRSSVGRRASQCATLGFAGVPAAGGRGADPAAGGADAAQGAQGPRRRVEGRRGKDGWCAVVLHGALTRFAKGVRPSKSFGLANDTRKVSIWPDPYCNPQFVIMPSTPRAWLQVRVPTHIVSSICDDRGEEPTYAGVTMSTLMEGDFCVGDVISLLW